MAKTKLAPLDIPTRLFEIGAELQAIYNEIDEAGEIPPALDQYITALDLAERSKAGNILGLMQLATSEAEAAKQFKEYFAKKQKAREATVEKLKQFVKDYLTLNGRDIVETDRGMSFKLEKAGGVKPITFKGRRISELSVWKDLDGRYMTRINDREVQVDGKYVKMTTSYAIDGEFVREMIQRHPDNPPLDFAVDDSGRTVRVR